MTKQSLTPSERSQRRDTVVHEGIGMTGAFLLLFVTLKLTGYISWSWLWVLSPIWMAAALFLAIILVLFVIVLVSEIRVRSKKGKQ